MAFSKTQTIDGVKLSSPICNGTVDENMQVDNSVKKKLLVVMLNFCSLYMIFIFQFQMFVIRLQ